MSTKAARPAVRFSNTGGSLVKHHQGDGALKGSGIFICLSVAELMREQAHAHNGTGAVHAHAHTQMTHPGCYNTLVMYDMHKQCATPHTVHCPSPCPCDNVQRAMR